MVDNMNPTPVPPVDPAAPDTGGKTSFAASKVGRIVIVAAGLAVLLGLLAAVAFFVFGDSLFSGTPAEAGQQQTTSAPAPSATASATAEEGLEPRDAEPMSDVFTFRNPFVPTVKPAVTATTASSSDTSSTSSTSSSSDSDSASSVPADTLALKSIKTEDGEYVATFIWNGKTYTAGEGDELEGTPWKVVNLTSNSATMLYGDSEVTLSVGQGISK